jgi:phosphopantothenate-cysteine ligase
VNLKVLVTSGGTEERIDAIRAIVNSGTGALGTQIAAAFAQAGAEVTYLASRKALVPEDPDIEIVRIRDTADLEREVRRLCEETQFDAVIHAMAVSDYRVKSVSSEGRELDRNIKIGSNHPELVIVMEQTPKVIALFHELVPNATLVGFKLLDNAPKEVLIEVARALLEKNHCTFVLANDTQNIDATHHLGYLLGADGSEAQFNTKPEIAAGIVAAVLASE